MKVDMYSTPKKKNLSNIQSINNLTIKQIFKIKEESKVPSTIKKISEFVKMETIPPFKSKPQIQSQTPKSTHKKSKDDMQIDFYKAHHFIKCSELINNIDFRENEDSETDHEDTKKKITMSKFVKKLQFDGNHTKLESQNLLFTKNSNYKKKEVLQTKESVPLKMEVKTNKSDKNHVTLDKFLKKLKKNDIYGANLEDILSADEDIFKEVDKLKKVEDTAHYKQENEFYNLNNNIYQECKDEALGSRYKYGKNNQDENLICTEKLEDKYFPNLKSIESSDNSFKSMIKKEQGKFRLSHKKGIIKRDNFIEEEKNCFFKPLNMEPYKNKSQLYYLMNQNRCQNRPENAFFKKKQSYLIKKKNRRLGKKRY